MGLIHLLDANVRELISAGEVVERPASVVKELVENSLDAGATKIEVDLKNNGIVSLTVTDNGKGMEKEDIPYAFLRHATSKIEYAQDLDNIGTLGFRGEALAAICAVSRVKLVTRTSSCDTGWCYRIEGGEAIELESCGAPFGTSITVSDIFYNTPARMKFLKKDTFEGNAIENLLWHMALTNPDVSFKLTRDGKQTIRTSGQGLYSAIFDLFPREISSNMIEISFKDDNVFVEGYVSNPKDSKASRNLQHVSVNGRFIKSRSIQSAVEEAYSSYTMQGKYPGFVLSIWLPYEDVDVNVHPAKTEIRFKNEKTVCSACYTAVRTAVTENAKNAVLQNKAVAQILGNVTQESSYSQPVKQDNFKQVTSEDYRKLMGLPSAEVKEIKGETSSSVSIINDTKTYADDLPEISKPDDNVKNDSLFFENITYEEPEISEEVPRQLSLPSFETLVTDTEKISYELKACGTLFDTYIVCESGDQVYFIDMHAAHERILYEQLRDAEKINSQQLLEPVIISVTGDEMQAVIDNTTLLDKLGFDIDTIGEREIAVRGVPTYLGMNKISDAVSELVSNMASGREEASFEAREWLYHSVACRAAIKAGHKCPREEMMSLAQKILCGDVPKFCPHGRPVYFCMSKNEIEKKFGRIQ